MRRDGMERRERVKRVRGDDSADEVGGVRLEEGVAEDGERGVEVVLQLDPGWEGPLALDDAVPALCKRERPGRNLRLARTLSVLRILIDISADASGS
jgi:hypothetical protein